MKTPIEPDDIRDGDLIRFERLSEGLERAVEFISDGPGGGLYAQSLASGVFYLLDRPAPPVVLPTEPTLAWVDGRLTYWDGADYADEITSAEVGETFTRAEITAFTPATAVPTEALDALRADHGDDQPGACMDVIAFLAAVDAANEAKS